MLLTATLADELLPKRHGIEINEGCVSVRSPLLVISKEKRKSRRANSKTEKQNILLFPRVIQVSPTSFEIGNH